MSDASRLAEVINFDKFKRSKLKKLPVLSERQIIAIEGKLAGKSCAEVAKTAGVTVRTLHKWMKDNPAFVAEMENRHEENWSDTMMTVSEIAQTSINSILKAIYSGDVRAAMWFVEKCVFNDADKSELSAMGALPFTFEGILNGFVDAETNRKMEHTKTGPFAFLKFMGKKKQP